MKISIQKKTIFWTILVFPFMRPNGIGDISPFIGRAYYIAMGVSFVILFLLYIRKRRSDLKFLIISACLMSWILIVTIFNSGEVLIFIRVMIAVIGIILCVEVMSETPKIMFVAFLTNFEIVIYLNFICLLAFPSGMYISQSGTQNWANWLLGYENHWFIVFFVAYYVAIMYAKFGGSRIRAGILIAIIHISMFITMSGAVIVGVVLMDILFLFRIYKLKIFNFFTVLGAGILAFVLLVFAPNSFIVQSVVYGVFQRATSFTARLSIWVRTIQYIARKPIIGYGRTSQEFRQLVIYHNYHGVNAHNMWLELLFLGGIIAFGLFVVLVVFTGRKIIQYKNVLSTKLWLVCFLACIVTLNIDSALELRGIMFFFLLAVGYRMKRLADTELCIKETS